MKNKKEMKVSKIKNGTVIDHIKARKSLEVIAILGLEEMIGDDSLFIGYNAIKDPEEKKGKKGKKDFLKIENLALSAEAIQVIALIAPEAKISIIKNWEVESKTEVKLPSEVKRVIQCPNKDCVTNNERDTDTIFKVIKDGKEPEFVCKYCEKMYPLESITIKL